MEAMLGRLVGLECQRLPLEAGEQSAALARLSRGAERNGDDPLLLLGLRTAPVRSAPGGTRWKWAALACALLVALVSLRYWEPFLKKPALARRLAEAKTAWQEAPELDRQLRFFQYLETNQPPYLETLGVVAEAAGRGAQFESLTLDRRGELSLKGTLPSADQAVKFRDKLIESGWFTQVVFEEQKPTGNNDPKVSVRMNARGKKPKPAAAGAGQAKKKG
jgi:hypothetical protein